MNPVVKKFLFYLGRAVASELVYQAFRLGERGYYHIRRRHYIQINPIHNRHLTSTWNLYSAEINRSDFYSTKRHRCRRLR